MVTSISVNQSLLIEFLKNSCVYFNKVSANLALMFYIIVVGMSYTCEVFVVHLPKFKALDI